MRLRNTIISAGVALLFFSAFAQEPSPLRPAPARPRQDTVQGDTVAKPRGERTIVNIKSKRMFPIQIGGDSTVHAFVGNVVAYHNGAVMLCDSAVRYDENRIECFENVLINKDSTYVYGDRVLYDRLTNTAQVFSPLIKMIDGQAVLYTYHFKYNTLDNVGEYYGGGTMSQGRMLLEMILLQADTMELRANPNRLGRGVIIEAKLDKARGPLATVLMQNGTLHVGDNIIAGLASGRVRALINDRGEKVKEAGPSTPVEIMGFDEVPSAGDEMQAVGDDRLSRQVAEERKAKVKASREATMAKVSLENMFSNMESGKQTTLNLIIKADVQGSVEAVKQAMEKLSSDEVKVHVLHSAAGAITKDDVNLASAFNAIIIGFNIRPDASAREAAEREKVDVRLYTVIYKAIEDMELAMKGLLAPEYREVLLGHAEVRNVFKITGAGVIAGCYVTDGKVQRNAQVRLLRDNVVVFEGKLSSLKHYKEDVKEMAAGFECGMSLEGHNDIKEGDVVECFIMEEIPR